MVRTQIQLDEVTYARVKNRAFSENKSMAALIREAVAEYLKMPQKPMKAPQKPKRKLTIDDFTFIGSGHLDPNYDGPLPLSVYHDEAFDEDWRD